MQIIAALNANIGMICLNWIKKSKENSFTMIKIGKQMGVLMIVQTNPSESTEHNAQTKDITNVE